MLKIVVFDGGFGGELFADKLEEALPVVEVIRVIDWRNAEALVIKARSARQVAEKALGPYLGKVDLIVLANHLLTVTSLRYFRRKYPKQKFIGLPIEEPKRPIKREILILTTRAVARTFNYRHFVWKLRIKSKTLALDTWPAKIDDGELTGAEIVKTLESVAVMREKPMDIILACAQFSDIKDELSEYFKSNVKVYDSFDTTIREICRVLKIRGGVGRKRR